MDPRILQIGLTLLPEAIAWFKALFKNRHPDLPELTDAEVIAGLQAAITSSLAQDAFWLASHPKAPDA